MLFAKEVATYISERVWHPSQQRNGSLEMFFTTSGRMELARWILSWMPYVRILAPAELQRRVVERMRQGLTGLASP